MRIFSIRLSHITLVLFLVYLIGLQPGRADEGPLVVILSSKDSLPYQQAADAFKDHLKKNFDNIRFYSHSLKGDDKNIEQIVDDIKNKNPVLIYVLGSLATRAAVEHINDRPIVAGFILNDSEVKDVPNATAVILEHSMATQLQWLRRLLPDVRTIGILYNPEENAQQIEVANKLARKQGVKVVAVKVVHPRDLPSALKEVSKRADVLLGIPDKIVLSRKTARGILLSSFRNRIPFVGLSSTWVKAGAIYALDWDYKDIGDQSGHLAKQIMRGTDVRALPPEYPRKVVYALNRKTIEHMNTEMTRSVIRDAIQVYE